MTNLAAVAFGGALGVIARYGVAVVLGPRTYSGFPVAIFLVNVSGSFVIGLCAGIFEGRPEFPEWARLAITVGFLGGYTTFSTLSLDIVRLAQSGRPAIAVADALLSLVAGVLAAAAGLLAARYA